MSRVRPRRIWLGVAAAVVGMVLTGVALTFAGSQPWMLWAGIGLLALGAVLALLGGIMHDVYGGQHGMASETRAVIAGDSRAGTTPGATMRVDSSAPTDPVTANAGAAEGTHLEPTPPPARLRLMAFGMVALAAWLVAAPLLLHLPDTETGNDVVFRDYTAAALVAITGFALGRTYRSVLLCVVPVLAGAGLLLATLLSPPLVMRMAVSEAISGMLAIALGGGYALVQLARR